jgi:predicted MFS family arabinose efflux permease
MDDKRRDKITLLLAAISCFTVMNIYYNQPLLALIGHAFGVSASTASSIPSLTQLGFGLGIVLFVPLGDTIDRRWLILIKLLIVSVLLLLVGLAPDFWMLVTLSFFMGIFTVIPQISIPFAAQIAPPNQRGRTIGMVMSGIFAGILISRALSGAVGDWLGWRAIFFIASGLMLVLAVVVAKYLPHSGRSTQLNYWQVLRSLPGILKQQPLIQAACVTGAFLFCIFSVFWSTLAFILASPPFHYGPWVAGILGLVGITGSAAAPLVGRLADKRGPTFTLGISILIVGLSALALLAMGNTMVGLIISLILLDLGVQAGLVSNQTRIYSVLPPSYNSRVNTIFMSSYFTGGAVGSVLGGVVWDQFSNHEAIGGLSAALVVIAFVMHLWLGRRITALTASQAIAVGAEAKLAVPTAPAGSEIQSEPSR